MKWLINLFRTIFCDVYVNGLLYMPGDENDYVWVDGMPRFNRKLAPGWNFAIAMPNIGRPRFYEVTTDLTFKRIV